MDLRPLVESTITSLRSRSSEEGKPIEFVLKADENIPVVRGDTERIQQVLMHLLANGYNYTPADGRVVTTLHQVDGMVQVDVQDNGIGIAPEVHNRIFERFYRGEDPLVLATPGTGLGLAISRTLVEMHHGQIWFTSTGVRGEGSKFSFTLPVYHAEEEK